MRAIDFKYDGAWLSNMGYMICTFGANGTNSASAGADIDFHIVSQNSGEHFALTNTEYKTCYSATFNICKDPETMDDKYISEYDVRCMMRWLSRRSFHEFIPVVDKGFDGMNLIYYGSFNVSLIENRGSIIGFELTVTTNSPFAYGGTIEESYVIDSPNGSFQIENMSDEIGALYPELFSVECKSAGDLYITNELENRVTFIKNCSNSEVITMDCKNQIISSSDNSHQIYNDFNFAFPRMFSTFEDTNNEFTFSLPCEVSIQYKPIRKVAL